MLPSFPYPEVGIAISSFILLYPEIHYVFKYFPFSRYRLKEPEIIADIPYRIEPGCPLPVLLLIKDSDQYPVDVESVTITRSNKTQSESVAIDICESIRSKWWYRIFTMEMTSEWRGSEVEIDVEINYVTGRKKRRIHNDNLPGLTHAPLKFYAASEKLPSLDGWIHGDMHFHTHYTDDQVEFGAPVDAAAEIAQTMGLQFFAATDHSYDLDDLDDNFLVNDPELNKWKRFRQEINELNQKYGEEFAVIPGEEVSCANSEGRNVHCLVYNNEQYLPGSGDSAERWLHNDAELTIGDIVEKADPSTLIVAAHPKDRAPLLEKIFLRRGSWTDDDCRTVGISGLQSLNGIDNLAFREGLAQWRRQLLRGERSYIYAGNDAHGNFNRYRQVKTLMVSLHEIADHQQFGRARIVVWMGENERSTRNILLQLKQGCAVITNGPMMSFTVENEEGEIFRIGASVRGRRLKCQVEIKSSDEMGGISEIKLWLGKKGEQEILWKQFEPEGLYYNAELILNPCSALYLRGEVKTSKNLFCYTNPIWLGTEQTISGG